MCYMQNVRQEHKRVNPNHAKVIGNIMGRIQERGGVASLKKDIEYGDGKTQE